jgi:phosphatidylserine decarboxylase
MDSLLENERIFSIIRGPDIRVGIVQIASRVVRRIVPFVKEGDIVCQGDRIGVIRFGSQVDVLIPNGQGVSVLVERGDYVKAGLSVLARLNVSNDTV